MALQQPWRKCAIFSIESNQKAIIQIQIYFVTLLHSFNNKPCQRIECMKRNSSHQGISNIELVLLFSLLLYLKRDQFIVYWKVAASDETERLHEPNKEISGNKPSSDSQISLRIWITKQSLSVNQSKAFTFSHSPLISARGEESGDVSTILWPSLYTSVDLVKQNSQSTLCVNNIVILTILIN